MKINSVNSVRINSAKSKNNVSFHGAMSDKVRHALTDEDDFVLKQYYEDIKNIKPLSRKEEKRLAKQIQQGGQKAEEAKQALIISALPTIVYYALTLKNYGVPLADVIQEANLAVIRLVNETNYDGKKPFRNFLYDTIYRRTHKAITESSRVIKLPLYIHDNVEMVKDAEAKLEGCLSRTPSVTEVAKKTGLNRNVVRELKMFGQPVEPLSKKNIEKANLLAQRRNARYEDEISRKIDNQQLKRCLLAGISNPNITPAEKSMLILRFCNCDSDNNRTLKSIAEKCNITKERVRQLLAKGIAKLRRMQNIRSNKFNLKEFNEYEDLSI